MKTSPLAYSVSQSCEITSLGRTSIYAAIKCGELKALKVGRRTLISAEALRSFLNAKELKRPAAAGMRAGSDPRDGDH